MQSSRGIKVLQAYVDYLNGIFNQTITDSRLVIIKRENCLIISRYQDGFLPLELQPQGYLHFRQFACVEHGKVKVEDCRYIYSVSADPDDEQQWVFRYEYCLTPAKNVPFAHIHLNAMIGDQAIKHIHFPTGRVSIEQIIAHLVTEHGVKPKTPEWFSLLSDSHQGFMKKRTDLILRLFP